MAGIYRKSRLSRGKQSRLMEHFVAGTTARTAAELVGVNTKTAAFYFHRLRQVIEHASEDDTPLAGEIEVDESYFGGHRKGKRGRGAGKMPVFGLLKRGGKVYARVIPDVKSRTLKPILERKIVPDSIVYSDTLNSYNVLDVLQASNTSGSITPNSSPRIKITSTASRTSGTRPSVTCAASTHPQRALPPLPQRVRVEIQHPQPKQQLIQLHQWLQNLWDDYLVQPLIFSSSHQAQRFRLVPGSETFEFCVALFVQGPEFFPGQSGIPHPPGHHCLSRSLASLQLRSSGRNGRPIFNRSASAAFIVFLSSLTEIFFIACSSWLLF